MLLNGGVLNGRRYLTAESVRVDVNCPDWPIW